MCNSNVTLAAQYAHRPAGHARTNCLRADAARRHTASMQRAAVRLSTKEPPSYSRSTEASSSIGLGARRHELYRWHDRGGGEQRMTAGVAQSVDGTTAAAAGVMHVA